MITLAHNDIINGVLRLMDEHGGNAQFMSGSDTSEARRIIDQVAEGAVRRIHLEAPVAMLDALELEKGIAPTRSTVNGRYVWTVMLPDDFFRLISCRMETWERNVSHLWWEDSAEYAKQKNKYLMNTWQRPAAFYVHHGTLKYVEMYSTDDDQDELREFLYAPIPTWNEGKTSFLCIADRLKDASLMQIAAETLSVLGESERAQQMQALASRSVNTYGGLERNFADNGNRIER